MGKRRAILAILAVLLVIPATVASQEQQESVLPPHSVVAGKTLGEWSALWWKWALGIPAPDNPMLDLNGAKSRFGDVGPVFFFWPACALRSVSLSLRP